MKTNKGKSLKDPETIIEMVDFMKSYYKENPTAIQTQLIEAMKDKLNIIKSDMMIKMAISRLWRRFNFVKHAFQHPKEAECQGVDRAWVKIHWPIYEGLQEALSYSISMQKRSLQNRIENRERPTSLFNPTESAKTKSTKQSVNKSKTVISTAKAGSKNKPEAVKNDDVINESGHIIDSILQGRQSLSIDEQRFVEITKGRLEELKIRQEHEIELKKLKDKQQERAQALHLLQLNNEREILKLKFDVKLAKYKMINQK